MYNVILDRPLNVRITCYLLKNFANARNCIREELLYIKSKNELTDDELYHIDFLIETNALGYDITLSNGKNYKGWTAYYEE